MPEATVWSSRIRLISDSLARTRRTKARVVERRIERVARDVRDRRRDRAAGVVRHEIGHREAPERALVDEAQLGSVVGEGQPDPQVLLVGSAGVEHEQLPAHAQVPDDRDVRRLRPVGQRQPQVLPATGHARRRCGPAAGRRSRPGRPGGGERPVGDGRPTSTIVRPATHRCSPDRTTSTSGSSGMRCARPSGPRGPGGRAGPGRTPSRRPAARPPSWTARPPRRAPRRR